MPRVVFDGPAPCSSVCCTTTERMRCRGGGWNLLAWITFAGGRRKLLGQGLRRIGGERDTNSLCSATATVSLTEAGLIITRSGDDVVLSWPASAVGFSLESAPSVQAPSWQPVLTAPAVQGSEIRITNAPSGGVRFYRLGDPKKAREVLPPETTRSKQQRWE